MIEEGLAWEDGRVHGATLGEMGDERDYDKWVGNYSEGLVCPVCLEPITDGSRACRCCWQEWKRICGSPHRLAQWVVAASEEPELLGRGIVVWRRGNNGG